LGKQRRAVSDPFPFDSLTGAHTVEPITRASCFGKPAIITPNAAASTTHRWRPARLAQRALVPPQAVACRTRPPSRHLGTWATHCLPGFGVKNLRRPVQGVVRAILCGASQPRRRRPARSGRRVGTGSSGRRDFGVIVMDPDPAKSTAFTNPSWHPHGR